MACRHSNIEHYIYDKNQTDYCLNKEFYITQQYWQPSIKQDPEYIYSKRITHSNSSQFMKKHKITSYQQLIQKSSKNTEWGMQSIEI